tara:strand:- start:2893 stop:3561 length:669 start_codon:yes stop_codon:yes gene_type:complete
MIILAGPPGAGKTTLAEGITKEIPSSFLLEKDVLNDSLSEVRPTTNGDLITEEEYLESQYTVMERDMMGDVIRLPKRSEFFGRHVRDQTYRAIVDLAFRNLEVGKSPILESLLTRQFTVDGLVEGMFEAFEDYRTIMIFTYIPEEASRKRLEERSARDEYARMRDKEKLGSEEGWRNYVAQHPIIPQNLDQFPHYKVDMRQPPEECVEEAVRQIYSKEVLTV